MKRHHGRSAEYDSSQIAVQRLDRAYWRISEAKIEAGEPIQLLGFVERIGRNRYEVLWMTEPIAWAYVNSLAIALAAITDRDEFASIIEPERDRSVPSGSTHLLHRTQRRRGV